MMHELNLFFEHWGDAVLLDLHLDPNHRIFTLFEAPNAEAVRDLLVRAGSTHYLELSFHLVTPIAEILKHADEMPTLY